MRNEVVLQKMSRYVEKLIAYCDGCSYENFIADMKLVEACVFNLRTCIHKMAVVDVRG